MTITLYDYWRSSASYRLRIAFGLAGLEYDAVSVNLLAGEQRGEAHLDRNPQGLVPSVDFEGQILSQSLAIIEYMHDAGYAHFLPQDLMGRARVRALSYAIAMEIHPICNLSVAKYAVANSDDGIDIKSWMQHFINKGLAGLEGMLSSAGDYCHGESISMADICLVPQLYNAGRWDVDMSGFSKINAIAARLDNLPAVAAAHPDKFKPPE